MRMESAWSVLCSTGACVCACVLACVRACVRAVAEHVRFWFVLFMLLVQRTELQSLSVLKLSMVGAVTVAAGREFQEGIMRGKNAYLKLSFFGE